MLTPNYTPMAFAEIAIIPRVATNKQLVASTQTANFTLVQFARGATFVFSIAETNRTRN
jgi:hypothetical protein